MKHGLGWETSLGETEPLPGFSHGAAGIAWALLELFALTGEERFRTTARAGIEYERSLYSSELGVWLDAYEGKRINRIAIDGKKSVVSTWCHGAPGIGLARIRCLDYLAEPTIRDEIETALKITMSNGFGLNHSLCHGDLGNLELLLQASEVLHESQWRHQTNRHSSIILDSIDEHGWLCGVPLGVETPGLMTGLAGIGYQLLRVAYPACVPSVLVLAPPKQQRFK
jgi:lantibiotic modifying enzyme